MNQKPINPVHESVTLPVNPGKGQWQPPAHKDHLSDRIMEELQVNKIFLNSDLNIMDFAKTVGTNRTYISSVINRNFDQNFCGFINAFRVSELERVIIEQPYYSSEKLAEICGFGSVNSMKRSVFTKMGLSFSEFRKQVLSEKIRQSN